MPSDLLDVNEASELWHVRPSTVRSWILKKKVSYVKLSGRVFIRRADAEALIEQSVVRARVPAKESEQ
jgi:hypothetical protein